MPHSCGYRCIDNTGSAVDVGRDICGKRLELLNEPYPRCPDQVSCSGELLNAGRARRHGISPATIRSMHQGRFILQNLVAARH
jgi:hypothetical protein